MRRVERKGTGGQGGVDGNDGKRDIDCRKETMVGAKKQTSPERYR